MKSIHFIIVLSALGILACKETTNKSIARADKTFSDFEIRFLDSYWKQYPSNSIIIGYGKYYENLVIPDSTSFALHVQFSRDWIDSLNTLDDSGLSDNNKISFNIIKNQLESDIWYQSIFNQQQWDASSYNLSDECYYLIHQLYAPLDDRLRILSKHL